MSPLPGFILVVEDSDEDFDTVRDAARRAALPQEIRRATTGDAALGLLADWERENQALPALVLLDLNTPGGDGREVLRAVRENPRLRALPLVVLSTSDNPRDLDFCYTSGANAYHTKPVGYPAHLAVLQQIFHYWLTAVSLPGGVQLSSTP